MATTKRKAAMKTDTINRSRAVPRKNPKNGPPVYRSAEPTSIPFERIEAAVKKVLAARGALATPKK
jgi:hypothetical protein